MKLANVRAFISNTLDESRDLRVFLLRRYRQIMTADTVGALTKSFIEKLVAEYGLINSRGKLASVDLFRTAWTETKDLKATEAAERRDHKLAKSNWSEAFITQTAPMTVVTPPLDTSAKNNPSTDGHKSGNPVGYQQPSIDVDAAVRRMFEEHRAELPPMPSPNHH